MLLCIPAFPRDLQNRRLNNNMFQNQNILLGLVLLLLMS
jgi:hypothetical protein